jgi:tetratricopeptide (TPR) repeat protein
MQRKYVTCPADEALAAWNAGALGDLERHSIENHAAECPACRTLALALHGVVPRGDVADAPQPSIIQPADRDTPNSGVSRRIGLDEAWLADRDQNHPVGALVEGATVGRYRVLGAVGSGAMGVVLRARDPMLDREVAIKMVNSADATAEVRARMIVEAQTLARIDHPNVVRVYDAGMVGEEAFVAMALVTGPTLAQWLAEAPRELAACLAVLRGVAAGIAAVHAAGLVHRDVKPDNIIVHDRTGVLIDLGLARPEVGVAGSGVAGTPGYLAPEVARGQRATAASDQFAWWRVVEATLRHTAVPAHRRRRIARALARGLADHPADRYASLADASAALGAAVAPRRALLYGAFGLAATASAALLLAGQAPDADPCEASSPTTWLVQRPGVTANLVAAGANAPRVVAAIDARAGRYAQLRAESCRAARSDVSETRTHALREQVCAEQVWTTIEGLVGTMQGRAREPVRIAVDSLINVLPLDRCTGDTIPAVLAPPPPASAREVHELYVTLDALESGSEDPVRALGKLRALEPTVARTGYAGVTIVWHAKLAAALVATGDVAGARRELEAELALGETAGDDEARVQALVDLYSLSDFDGAADPELRKAAEAAAARLGSPGMMADLKMRESTTLANSDDLPGALAAIREAARLFEPLAIDAHAQLVDVERHVAAIEQATGDVQAARAAYDRAYALALQRFPRDDRRVLEIRGMRASMLFDLHEPQVAHREFAAVVAAFPPAFRTTPLMMVPRNGLCEADLQLGDVASAEQSCNAALALAEAWGADAPLTLDALVLAGRQRLAAHRAGEAIPLLERAAAIDVNISGARAVARGYLALALQAAHRDPARAGKLGRDAAIALHDESDRADLVAQLAATFPR